MSAPSPATSTPRLPVAATPPLEAKPPATGRRSSLRAQLGTALQKHRLRRGLTQAQLAEFADLSLKYVGEIERGEAKTTLEAIEKLADAIGWNPMDALDGVREPISEGVRVMLMVELQQMEGRLATMTKWLQALDPALHPAGRLAPALPEAPGASPKERPRPRKRKPETG